MARVLPVLKPGKLLVCGGVLSINIRGWGKEQLTER